MPVYDLVVIHAWGDYAIGDRIDDVDVITAALRDRPDDVVQIRWLAGSSVPLPDDPTEDTTNG